MTITPFGLESPDGTNFWNLTVDDSSGNLQFNANSITSDNTRMSIDDGCGGITIYLSISSSPAYSATRLIPKHQSKLDRVVSWSARSRI